RPKRCVRPFRSSSRFRRRSPRSRAASRTASTRTASSTPAACTRRSEAPPAMQTNFTLAQLADPDTAVSETILRACVHCGFCTATCPTYVLLGDELDGPRGRIYLIKDMLENDRPASPTVVTHIDRCLSCLSCMTTCPSGVHYMHLVDHARRRIAETGERPLPERLYRRLLATVLPSPALLRLALVGAQLARPFARLLPQRLAAMLRLAEPPAPPSPLAKPQAIPAV